MDGPNFLHHRIVRGIQHDLLAPDRLCRFPPELEVIDSVAGSVVEVGEIDNVLL